MGAMKNLYTKIQCGETLTAPEKAFIKASDPKSFARLFPKVAIAPDNPTTQLDLFAPPEIQPELKSESFSEFVRMNEEDGDEVKR